MGKMGNFFPRLPGGGLPGGGQPPPPPLGTAVWFAPLPRRGPSVILHMHGHMYGEIAHIHLSSMAHHDEYINRV